MSRSGTIRKARKKRDDALRGDSPMDDFAAHIIIKEAAKTNPRLKEAVAFVLAERQSLIESFDLEALMQSGRFGGLKAAANKPRLQPVVERVA